MSKPTVVSLFTGAGGLDYGLEAAGFRVAVATDIDHDSCETLRGLKRFEVVQGDILDESQVSSTSLLNVASLRSGDVDLLVGGPPCQPFSKSGYWVRGDSRRLDDPRAATLTAYLRILEELLPKAFLLENVDGLSYAGKSEGLDFLLRAIHDINHRTGTAYAPSYTVLNAADFGVPQVRRRLFVVAARHGTVFDFPKSLAVVAPGEKPRLASDGTHYFRNAWDALADASVDGNEDLTVRGKWAGLLPSIPEGHNYLYHTDRGKGLPLFGWRRRYWGFLLKLAKDRPSWTIQAQSGPAIGPFHWDSRRLSRHELCRLQTFPDVVVTGSRVSVQRQIGNAVPSLLTEILGRAIRTQLLGLPALTAPLALLRPLQSHPPAPKPTQAVPDEYLTLSGHHDAHPGAGQGVGAKRRANNGRELVTAAG